MRRGFRIARSAAVVLLGVQASCYLVADPSQYDTRSPWPPVNVAAPDDAASSLEDGSARASASDATGAERAEGAPPDHATPGAFGPKWRSPNGAIWSVTDAGTRITGDRVGVNHPVIAITPPLTDASDYTVRAEITAGESLAEVGLVARLQPDGGALVLGIAFSQAPQAFLGAMNTAAIDWNPQPLALGPAYAFSSGMRVQLALQVKAANVAGKLWPSNELEPDGWQVLGTGPWSEGAEVGFYAYLSDNSAGVALSRLWVTVP